MSSIKREKELPDDFGKRRGFFKVSGALFDSADRDFLDFMSNFLVIRAEYMLGERALHYDAYSMLFEPISEVEESPEYTFEIKKIDGEMEIKAIRQQHGQKLLRLLRKIDA